MDLNSIRPAEPIESVSQAQVQAAQSKLDKITPLTGQAAKPIFDRAEPLPDEWPFSRTASVKDDLAPVKARVQNLWKNKDNMTPKEMVQNVNQLRKGLQHLEAELEDLEFDAKFGIADMLDARQKGSFASELLSITKNSAKGG